jgi:hypothetical protein
MDLQTAAIWLSLLKVVNLLWGNLPLNIPDSAGLSRHGVQHGRTEPPNTKTEIVRLLNTLETALALHELLRENREFSIKESNGSKRMQPALALIHANFFLREESIGLLTLRQKKIPNPNSPRRQSLNSATSFSAIERRGCCS